MKKYFMKAERYERTESGKNWKSNPVEVERTEITEEQYKNIIGAVKFFRNLGGYERVIKGYTCEGYIPVRLISISPDKETKIVRYFTPVR